MEVKYEFCPNYHWVKELWLELQPQAELNPFLNWLWIGTWLEMLDERYIVVSAKIDKQLVGLGVLVKKTSKFGGDRYYLHRTGDEAKDRIWIEYNDFLLVRDNTDNIRDQMITFIMQNIVKNGVLYIGASLPVTLADCHTKPHIHTLVKWQASAYRTSLFAFKDVEAYRNSLSKNTRYQIVRSLRNYRTLGKLTIKRYTQHEVQYFFDKCTHMHSLRWGEQSGFQEAFFTQFHLKLAHQGVVSNQVLLQEIKVGEYTLGLLYHFCLGKSTYFYLGALNYALDGNHLKPGLVAHYLLIEQALEQQKLYYDFMGGDAQYKVMMTNQSATLQCVELRKKGVISCGIDIAQQIKRFQSQQGEQSNNKGVRS